MQCLSYNTITDTTKNSNNNNNNNNNNNTNNNNNKIKYNILRNIIKTEQKGSLQLFHKLKIDAHNGSVQKK